MNRETPVPVVMYHTVGIPNPDWHLRHLTCPYEVFEGQMRWLKKAGFATVTLTDLYNYIFGGIELPRKSVVLTFDDGYADNWVFAYPVLKKYGFRGTIFVCPEFVDGRDIVRKRVDEVDHVHGRDTLETSGFLSWREMKEAVKDGVFDIQAHAMTHTWYPVTERIVDFRHPGDTYMWMTWNQNVQKKPFLQFDDETLVRYGEPVYEHAKSLASPRFFPNDEIADTLTEFVQEHGGTDFFRRPDWRNVLCKQVEITGRGRAPGCYETEEEYERRVFAELSDSKRILEEKLDKDVDFLCWPGGSGSEIGMAAARRIGYRMSTAAQDLTVESRSQILNAPSQRLDRIARLNSAMYWDGRSERDTRIAYTPGPLHVLFLYQYKRMWPAQYLGGIARKLIKAYYVIRFSV